MLLLKLSFSLLVVSNCYAYKVLIYSPQIGHSHVTFFAHIADTLVQAGHDVVLYEPAYYDDVTTTGAGGLARVLQWPLPKSLPYSAQHILSDKWTDHGSNPKQKFKIVMDTAANMKEHCEMQMADEVLLEKLREENFDVGISETWILCGFVLFDRIGIRANIGAFTSPLIDVISEDLGAVTNPSYIPGTFSQFSDVMSYTERVQNSISYVISWFIHDVFFQPVFSSICTDPQFDEIQILDIGSSSGIGHHPKVQRQPTMLAAVSFQRQRCCIQTKDAQIMLPVTGIVVSSVGAVEVASTEDVVDGYINSRTARIWISVLFSTIFENHLRTTALNRRKETEEEQHTAS